MSVLAGPVYPPWWDTITLFPHIKPLNDIWRNILISREVSILQMWSVIQIWTILMNILLQTAAIFWKLGSLFYKVQININNCTLCQECQYNWLNLSYNTSLWDLHHALWWHLIDKFKGNICALQELMLMLQQQNLLLAPDLRHLNTIGYSMIEICSPPLGKYLGPWFASASQQNGHGLCVRFFLSLDFGLWVLC